MIQLTIPKINPVVDMILDPSFIRKVLISLLFVLSNW